MKLSTYIMQHMPNDRIPATDDKVEQGEDQINLGEVGRVWEVDVEQHIPEVRNHDEEQIVFIHDDNYNQAEIVWYEIV